MTNMKIFDAVWFTEMGSRHPIGIVMGIDEVTGEKKAYIGKGFGVDEIQDAKSILERGAGVYPETLKSIANFLQNDASISPPEDTK